MTRGSTALLNANQAPISATPVAAGLLGILAAPAVRVAALGDTVTALSRDDIAPLLERTAFHRIDGLAHRAISRLPQRTVHPWLSATFRRRHERQAAAALIQGMALAEVLEALARADLRAAVLGGLRTGEWVYGDRGCRPCGRHDLVILPRELGATRNVLTRLGLEERAPGRFHRGSFSLDLVPEVEGVWHREGDRSPLSSASLLARGSIGSVAGAPAVVLSPEDELLLMALEMVRHSFDRLIRVADLAHLLAAHGARIRWEIVRERGSRSGLRRVLGRALESLALVGVEPPEAAPPAPLAGALERGLMRRALRLQPVSGGGGLLFALTSPGLMSGLNYVFNLVMALRGRRNRDAARERGASVIPFRDRQRGPRPGAQVV